MRFIMMGEMPDMNIAIADPDRIDHNPTSSFVNPNFSSPISSVTARSHILTWSDFMFDNPILSRSIVEMIDFWRLFR